jgi:Putative transposase/Transposase zinc-binding domain
MTAATACASRPALELADVLRAHGQQLLDRYAGQLTAGQRRVVKELALCRTAALGGHVEGCADCGYQRPAYNSCRNRHCPKCQASARAAWLERESAALLPVPYYHVVFTLPGALARLALANPAPVYGLLFRAAWETVRELASDPHYLGAEVGLLAVLHTWGQNLSVHPHVHCVVTGGGLACELGGRRTQPPRWVSCRPGFFLPVRVLSRLFRGKFLAGLRAAQAAGELACRGTLAHLADAAAFAAWLAPLAAQEWVVYAKKPFGGPEMVLKYLARYTHRVAISNRRLVQLADGKVTFRYKDYAADQRSKTLTLDAVTFLRRFLCHVLPSGFVRLRHYGLLANRHRAAKLQISRRLLWVVTATALLLPAAGPGAEPVAAAPSCCPACGSPRWQVQERQPRPSVRLICQLPLVPDSS